MAPSVDDIRERIDYYLQFRTERRSYVEIAFFGGNFLGLPARQCRRMLELASEYIDRRRVDGIRFSTRPDTVDRERVATINAFPVTTVEIGAQSMDNRVLAAARRGHSAEDTARAVQLLKSTACRIGLQLMAGLPGESEAGSLASARAAASLAPDFVRIYPTLVIAGSGLSHRYAAGFYRPLTLEAAVRRVKGAFLIFRQHGVAVVRMGLQASRELDDGAALLAGPYHPAFGDLVMASLFLDAAVSLLDRGFGTHGGLSVFVHPRCVSRMRGQKNANVNMLQKRYRIQSIRVETDKSLAENMLRINGSPAVAVYN
jgi:histone acetyltransferase (RNA polymerase elongator complex component)